VNHDSAPSTALLHLVENRLAVALSAARLGSWEFDLRTRVLTSSAQCKANHGFRADDDMQLEPHILESIPGEHRARFVEAVEGAIRSQGAFEIEVPNTWPDGTEHWLLIAGRMADATCMVGVSQDITRRWRLEQELRDADRRKDEFLAVVAHELRGPIAPIVTAVKLLQAMGPKDPALERFRETILRQTMQLATLVDDLLDIGRITAGKIRLDKSRIDLRDVVRQAVEASMPVIERHHHRLDVHVPEPPAHVEGDAARLAQVVANLLNNAAKYSADGGHIQITLVEEQGMGVVSVRDQGIGIPPEMIDRIFDRFVQVGTSDDRAEGGLGIGLSVVKALVELHGGSVDVHSGGPGKGSEFSVRVPLIGTGAPV
jgi:signal transduction histidine kinase